MIFSAIIPIEELTTTELTRKRQLEAEIRKGTAYCKFDLNAATELVFWINYYMGYESTPQIIVFESSKLLEIDMNSRLERGALLNTNMRDSIYFKDKRIGNVRTHIINANEIGEGFFINFNNVDDINFYHIMNDISSPRRKLLQPCIFELLFQELEILIRQTESFDFTSDDPFDSSFFRKIENFRAIIEAYEIETVYSDIVVKISDLYRKSYIDMIFYSPILTLISKCKLVKT
ncbi:MAG: hypothetical protein ACKVOU_13905 [Cytophagales bacterium]